MVSMQRLLHLVRVGDLNQVKWLLKRETRLYLLLYNFSYKIIESFYMYYNEITKYIDIKLNTKFFKNNFIVFLL